MGHIARSRRTIRRCNGHRESSPRNNLIPPSCPPRSEHEAIAKLRDSLKPCPPLLDDMYIVRFFRACKRNIECVHLLPTFFSPLLHQFGTLTPAPPCRQTKQRLQDHLAWRAAEKIDEIESWEAPDALRLHYPCKWLGNNKEGG